MKHTQLLAVAGFVILGLGVLSFASSPFDGRDYGSCHEFRVNHSGKIREIIPAGDGANLIYIVDAPEPYFSWRPLVLRVGLADARWHGLSVGDNVNLEMMHDTSDVPLNDVITEGFRHALIAEDSLSYFGFLLHNVDRVESISLEGFTDVGEAGPYSIHWLELTFQSGETHKLNVASPLDPSTVAKVGDKVLFADSFTMQEHVYSPNPFGDRKVFQRHWTGPMASGPLYLKPSYRCGVFNLSRSTMHAL